MAKLEKAGKQEDKTQFANWLNHHRDLSSKSPEDVLQAFYQATTTVGDSATIETWVGEVIRENPGAVNDYKIGKIAVIGFLIGQVQRLAQGKSDTAQVKKLLEQKLQ